MRTASSTPKQFVASLRSAGSPHCFPRLLGVQAQSVAPALTLEAKIPLGDVSGRIDHMAIDPKRQRLFVAELGNNTVGVVDLKERKVVHVITDSGNPKASPTCHRAI